MFFTTKVIKETQKFKYEPRKKKIDKKIVYVIFSWSDLEGSRNDLLKLGKSCIN